MTLFGIEMNFAGKTNYSGLARQHNGALWEGDERFLRVPNRFFGIRDLAYFKAGIQDFEGKGVRDSGL